MSHAQQNEVKDMASTATGAWLKGSGDVRNMRLIFCGGKR